MLAKFPDANIIWDEAPIGGPDGIHPKDLKALAKSISPRNVFWIACNHNQPKKEDLEPGNCLPFDVIVFINEQHLTKGILIDLNAKSLALRMVRIITVPFRISLSNLIPN